MSPLDSMTFFRRYQDDVLKGFGGSVVAAPIKKDPEGVRNQINGIVAASTSGMIKDLMPSGSIF